jgi:hypothetical protein
VDRAHHRRCRLPAAISMKRPTSASFSPHSGRCAARQAAENLPPQARAGFDLPIRADGEDGQRGSSWATNSSSRSDGRSAQCRSSSNTTSALLAAWARKITVASNSAGAPTRNPAIAPAARAA